MSCPRELLNYTIKNTEVEVDNFFYFTPAENWSFYDYYLWFADRDKKAKFNKAIHNYHNNLNKTKETRTLNDNIRSYAANLINNSKVCYVSGNNTVNIGETVITKNFFDEQAHNSIAPDQKGNSLLVKYSGKNVKLQDYNLYLAESTTLQSSLFNICLENLCDFNKLKKLDLSYLSAFLSGIVNTIDVHNWPIIEEYCSNITMENIVKDNLLENFDKYSDSILQQLMADIKKIFIEKGINGLKIFIYERNLHAYKGNVDPTSSPTLIMLDMLDHIINMVKYSTWMDESEAGYLEYWKPLFKILFRDNDIYIKSGELSCEASKIDRKINEYEYGISSKNIMGRKIDLIFYINIDNAKYELLPIEFKPMNITSEICKIQRNKNLRLNKSIMSKLIHVTGKENTNIIGMDVVGKSHKRK
ncbi:unnamed protein product [Cunninghamella echinulata]